MHSLWFPMCTVNNTNINIADNNHVDKTSVVLYFSLFAMFQCSNRVLAFCSDFCCQNFLGDFHFFLIYISLCYVVAVFCFVFFLGKTLSGVSFWSACSSGGTNHTWARISTDRTCYLLSLLLQFVLCIIAGTVWYLRCKSSDVLTFTVLRGPHSTQRHIKMSVPPALFRRSLYVTCSHKRVITR